MFTKYVIMLPIHFIIRAEPKYLLTAFCCIRIKIHTDIRGQLNFVLIVRIVYRTYLPKQFFLVTVNRTIRLFFSIIALIVIPLRLESICTMILYRRSPVSGHASLPFIYIPIPTGYAF